MALDFLASNIVLRQSLDRRWNAIAQRDSKHPLIGSSSASLVR